MLYEGSLQLGMVFNQKGSYIRKNTVYPFFLSHIYTYIILLFLVRSYGGIIFFYKILFFKYKVLTKTFYSLKLICYDRILV